MKQSHEPCLSNIMQLGYQMISKAVQVMMRKPRIAGVGVARHRRWPPEAAIDQVHVQHSSRDGFSPSEISCQTPKSSDSTAIVESTIVSVRHDKRRDRLSRSPSFESLDRHNHWRPSLGPRHLFKTFVPKPRTYSDAHSFANFIAKDLDVTP